MLKFIRDWRVWSALLISALAVLYVVHIVRRSKTDYAEVARTAAVAKGWKKEELLVNSMTMSSSPFVGDEATVIFRIGNLDTGKKVIVTMRRSVFGPPTVESISEN